MKTLWFALLCVLVLASIALAGSFDVTISWQDNTTNEEGFRVYQKTGAGAYTQVGQVGQNVTTYSVTGLAEATTYCFKVGAYNAISELQSPEACGPTGSPVGPGAPGVPIIIYLYKQ